jgi:hypothetical protein
MEVRKAKRLTFGQRAQPGRRVCFVCIFGSKSIRIRYDTVYDGLESYAIGMGLDRDRGRYSGGYWCGRRWLGRRWWGGRW